MLTHLHTFYEELKRDGVMFCFSGPTSQSVVEGIGQALKRKMELEETGMSTMQRVFSIFVEQMQNILNYSVEQTPPETEDGSELRHGVVVVGRCEGKFYVICGNKVRRAQSSWMLENIRLLQQMDRQELKEHYKRVRRQEPEQGSKGAGLGFIEMFRRASEPLECHVAPLDEETVFFSVKAIG
jgi:hypothetical protein